MLFAVLGFHIVGRVISDRAAFLARLPVRETIVAIAVGFGVLLIDLLPFSLYQTVLPHVSPTRIYEEFLLKRNEVHPQLVEAWAAMADEEQNPEETRRRIEALRTQHEHSSAFRSRGSLGQLKPADRTSTGLPHHRPPPVEDSLATRPARARPARAESASRGANPIRLPPTFVGRPTWQPPSPRAS
jgi:hypothetical protein